MIFFLPGFFSIPAIDRDEARFAQATKQMVETGDFVDIRFQEDVRYKKPVGVYWLQSAVVEGASKLGLPRVLVTCNVANEGSRRTIERNGGVLEDIRDTEIGRLRRYWITISDS